jgi:hypothetical protein
MLGMRLEKRGKYYYVEFARGKRKSLGVTDKFQADRLFQKLKKQELEGKLHVLDAGENLKISEFVKRYVNDADRKQLSENTLRNDKIAFKSLQDVLGDIPLGFISKNKIKKYKDTLIIRL